MTLILHATTVAVRGGGSWRGLLICGRSGVGKSDLALRLVERGWRLVADDRTLVWRSGGRLFGRAPDCLAGLIEAWGLGIAPIRALPFARVVASVECVSPAHELERLPEAERRTVLGLDLPLLRLQALEASAPAKLARFVARRAL